MGSNTCTVQSGGQPQPREPVASQETTRNSSKEQVKVGREQEVFWREIKVGLGGAQGVCSRDISSPQVGGIGPYRAPRKDI